MQLNSKIKKISNDICYSLLLNFCYYYYFFFFFFFLLHAMMHDLKLREKKLNNFNLFELFRGSYLFSI